MEILSPNGVQTAYKIVQTPIKKTVGKVIGKYVKTASDNCEIAIESIIIPKHNSRDLPRIGHAEIKIENEDSITLYVQKMKISVYAVSPEPKPATTDNSLNYKIDYIYGDKHSLTAEHIGGISLHDTTLGPRGEGQDRISCDLEFTIPPNLEKTDEIRLYGCITFQREVTKEFRLDMERKDPDFHT